MSSPQPTPEPTGGESCPAPNISINVTSAPCSSAMEMTIQAVVPNNCSECAVPDKDGGNAEGAKGGKGASAKDGASDGKKDEAKGGASDEAEGAGSDGADGESAGGSADKPFDPKTLARRRRTRLQMYHARSGTVGLPRGDTGAASCNEKITKDSKGHLKTLYGQVDEFFMALSKAPELIDKYDFNNVGELVSMVEKIAETMFDVTEKLCYSPLITEITELCTHVAGIVDYASTIPALIYVRLVDLGFYLHEFGNLLSEEILPIEFASIVQRVETHLRKLKTGAVYTQIIYVPLEYDPVVTPFYKDPRLKRLEQLGNCKVTLLRPDDPRAFYCPINFRTIEVEYEEEKNQYLGFAELLNRCVNTCSKCFPIRASEIVVKRCANGTRHVIKPEEVEPLRQRLAYTTISDVQADMASGGHSAAVCPIPRMKEFVE